MKALALPFLPLLLFVLTSIACSRAHQSQQETAPKSSALETAPLAVKAQVHSMVQLSSPLQVRWQITNVAARPIYIYATPMKYNAAAEVAINGEQRLIEVRFLRLEPISVGVNAFPAAEFIKLDLNESRNGDFISSQVSGKLGLDNSNNKGKRGQKVTPGTWQIRIAIAYGYEIESVQKALTESLAKGVEHPINPVVKWQKIAYSNPISVVFQQ